MEQPKDGRTDIPSHRDAIAIVIETAIAIAIAIVIVIANAIAIAIAIANGNQILSQETAPLERHGQG